MAQRAVVIDGIDDGVFTPVLAESVWKAVTGSSPSDLSYAESDNGYEAASFQVAIDALEPPLSTSGHVLRFRCWHYRGDTTYARVIAKLYDGDDLIAVSDAKVLDYYEQTFEYTLSSAEAGAISDYGRLSVAICRPESASSRQRYYLRCSWVAFDVPDAPQFVGPSGVAGTSSVGSPRVAFVAAPSGIGSGASLGSPTVEPGAVEVSPAGVKSGSSVGSPRVALSAQVDGIDSTSGVGSPRVRITGEALRQMATSVRSDKVAVVEFRTAAGLHSGFDAQEAPAKHSFSSHSLVLPRIADDAGGGGALFEMGFVRPLLSGLTIRNALVQGSVLRGRTEPDTATAVLLNNGELDGLGDEVQAGTRAVVGIGTRRSDEFEKLEVFSGQVDQISMSRDGRSVVASLRSADSLLDLSLNWQTWQGFGTALSLSGDRHGSMPYADWMDAEQFTVEFLISLGYDPSGAGKTLILSRTNGTFEIGYDRDTHKYTFYVHDTVGNSCGGMFGPIYPPSTAFVVKHGWDRFSVSWNGSALELRVNGGDDVVASWQKPAGFGVLRSGSGALRIGAGEVGDWRGDSSSAQACVCRLTDIRLWGRARTAEEIREWALRPLSDESDEDLLLYLKTNESEGNKLFDDVRDRGACVLGGSDYWTTTFTGDPELAGRRMPTSWGWVWNRGAVLVDRAERLYAAHSNWGVRRILKVMEGGAGLARDVAILVGSTKHDAERRRITAHAEIDWPGFAYFVRGQEITISSGLNAGNWTVRDVDEIEGRWIEVEEEIDGGSELQIRQYATKSGTAAWEAGNAIEEYGMFRLLAAPSKEITCRVVGEEHEEMGSSVPGLMLKMAGFAVPEVLGDGWGEVHTARPWVAGYATGEEEESIGLAWSRLASSIGAMFGTKGRVYDIWLFKEPPGNNLDNLPERETLVLTEEEILSIEWLSEVKPIGRAVVRYRPNFRVLADGDLVGALAEDMSPVGRRVRNEITSPSLSEMAEAGTGEREEEDILVSYLRDREAALRVARMNLRLYGRPREAFRVGVKLQPYLYDWRRCAVVLRHRKWASLHDGKGFRILSREGDRTRVTMEVWG